MIRWLLLTLLLLPLAAAAQDRARSEAAEAELAALQQRIQTLSQQLGRDRDEQDQLQTGLQRLEQGIAEAQGELRQLDTRLRQQEAETRKTRTAREQAAAALAEQHAALARQLRSAFIMGQGAETRLLLNLDDAQRLGRAMTYYDYLNRARTAHIDLIAARTRDLQSAEQRLNDAQQALAATRDQQALALRQLETRRGERARAIGAVEARIRDTGQALQQLQREEAGVQQLLESLRDILSDIPSQLGNSRPFAQLRGRLFNPVRGGGRLLARFGQAKSGTSLNWKGQWIAASNRTPVRAAAGGRVAYVGWMHRYGLMVILEHEGDYYTLYGHADSADVRVGQWVEAGAVIARAGNSGGHRESGVYFEIRRGRTALDPQPWLSR